MNSETLTYLPAIAPVAIGVLFSNYHVDARFSDVSKLITAESARLEAVLRLEISSVANVLAGK
jgi:hypothetical protein